MECSKCLLGSFIQYPTLGRVKKWFFKKIESSLTHSSLQLSRGGLCCPICSSGILSLFNTLCSLSLWADFVIMIPFGLWLLWFMSLWCLSKLHAREMVPPCLDEQGIWLYIGDFLTANGPGLWHKTPRALKEVRYRMRSTTPLEKCLKIEAKVTDVDSYLSWWCLCSLEWVVSCEGYRRYLKVWMVCFRYFFSFIFSWVLCQVLTLYTRTHLIFLWTPWG